MHYLLRRDKLIEREIAMSKVTNKMVTLTYKVLRCDEYMNGSMQSSTVLPKLFNSNEEASRWLATTLGEEGEPQPTWSEDGLRACSTDDWLDDDRTEWEIEPVELEIGQ